MSYTTLIDAADLERRLDTRGLVIVDCRFDLAAPGAGGEAYARGHVPAAYYAHLDRDLAGRVTASSGRHPLPEVEQFVATLRRWGAGPDSLVVAYDGGNGMIAARLWWMLRWLGHTTVAVLNGGWQGWSAGGRPQSTAAPAPAAGTFRAGASRAHWVSTEEVALMIGQRRPTIVDARAAERFAGISEPIDPVAGHVPGAINHPATLNLDASGRFLAPAELRAQWLRTLGERASTDIVAMCGSGVSACQNLLAMEIAGLSGARLYPGSWSEWIRDRRRPIATGASD